MSFIDDNDGLDDCAQKRLCRQQYIEEALELFKQKHPAAIISRKTAMGINTVYWDLILPYMKNKMGNPQNRIDQHKIISGIQCAIMATNLIRTKDTVDIQDVTGESKGYADIRAINAKFALYLALDILEQWNDIELSPLEKRKNFLREHLMWLNTAAILREDYKFSFPFFAISQMWYLAEELCLTEN